MCIIGSHITVPLPVPRGECVNWSLCYRLQTLCFVPAPGNVSDQATRFLVETDVCRHAALSLVGLAASDSLPLKFTALRRLVSEHCLWHNNIEICSCVGGMQSAVAAMDAKANVCSVQFSPTDPNIMAFGAANYRTYMYDLRRVQVRVPCQLSPGWHVKLMSHPCFDRATPAPSLCGVPTTPILATLSDHTDHTDHTCTYLSCCIPALTLQARDI